MPRSLISTLLQLLMAAFIFVAVTGLGCDAPTAPGAPDTQIQMKFVNSSNVAMHVLLNGPSFTNQALNVNPGATVNEELPGSVGDAVSVQVSTTSLFSATQCGAGPDMVSPASAYGQVTLGIGGSKITITCDSTWR